MNVIELWVAKGERIEVDGEIRTVVEIGEVLNVGPTGSITPVRYDDGSYGFIAEEPQIGWQAFVSGNPEAASLIRHSARMPTIHHGAGSDVFHAYVYEREKKILIRIYYNSKEDRGDTVHRT